MTLLLYNYSVRIRSWLYLQPTVSPELCRLVFELFGCVTMYHRSCCSSIEEEERFTFVFFLYNLVLSLSQCPCPKMIPLPSLPVLVLHQRSCFPCGIKRVIFLRRGQRINTTVKTGLKLIKSHRRSYFSSTIRGNVHFLHDKLAIRRADTQCCDTA